MGELGETARPQGFLLVNNEGWRWCRCSAKDAVCRRLRWVGAWVERTWKSGGHPSLRCCAVIRQTSGSCGLFELFVPSIIRLSSAGHPGLHQAYKHLIYSLTGDERRRLSWRGFRVFWLRWQGTEVMDSRTQPSQTPFPTPTPAPPSVLTPLIQAFHESSIRGRILFCFILLLSVHIAEAVQNRDGNLHFAVSCSKTDKLMFLGGPALQGLTGSALRLSVFRSRILLHEGAGGKKINFWKK